MGIKRLSGLICGNFSTRAHFTLSQNKVYFKFFSSFKVYRKMKLSQKIVSIVFLNLTFKHRFDSQQVKLNLISSKRNFIYKLSHELLKKLRLQIFFQEHFKKILKLFGDMAKYAVPSTNKILPIAVKNYVKSDIKIFLSCHVLHHFFNPLQMFCI